MPADIVDPVNQAQEGQPQLYRPGMSVINDYEIVSGVCILPVAESPPEDIGELAVWSPVVKLQLHSPYRIRRAKYATKKSTTPPVLPSPKDVGSFVFTGGSLFFTTGVNSTMVSSDWTVQAEYTYVENCVSRTTDGFVLGVPGYVLLTQEENQRVAGGTFSPQLGAIAHAGTDAKVGYTLSQNIDPASGLWSYTCQSYFPGKLFNDYLPNGSQSAEYVPGGQQPGVR